MKYLVLLLLVAAATNARLFRRYRRNADSEYKMCVAEELLDICNQMAAEETTSKVKITCVSQRDRSECIEILKEHKADFIAAEPEDMLIAAKVSDQDFAVFEEVRTHEEPDAEFRYEGVVVIHKDLKIEKVQDIKGLKSCHTGVGRNVGYKVPLTKLKNMGIIGNLAEPELSPRENELKAFSTLFSKSCIVGKWSSDPEINKKLKQKYKNLCAMCEYPEKCDYPDLYSGYEGALRCLVHNGGEIAFTKVIFVRKFFGLSVGTIPVQPSNENPDDYAYFCPDGSRVPVRGPPCIWAARPWPGYMAHTAALKKIDDLRQKLQNLHTIGNSKHPSWFEKVLELSNKTFPKDTKAMSPSDYLGKANYTDVLERDYGPPFKTIKMCVRSQSELKKCQLFSEAAFSRNIRPRFACVQENSDEGCFKSIQEGKSDIITVDGDMVVLGQKSYNLKPIVSEVYGDLGSNYYSLAVVKKDSKYQSFADLRGSRSCHTGFGHTRDAGYNGPLNTLIKLGLIKPDQCPYSSAISEYFSGGSCMPGAKTSTLLTAEAKTKLCSQCAGDCGNSIVTEPYVSHKGAFRCLVEGKGDVAFVKQVTIKKNTDGANKEEWAANLKSEDFELLCPNGGRAPVDQFDKCNVGHFPSRMVVTSNAKTTADVDEIVSTLISVAELYSKRPDLFKLFGVFENQNDLLFKNTASALVATTNEVELLEDYVQLLNVVKHCEHV